MVVKLFLEPSVDVGCTQVIKFFVKNVGIGDEDVG